MGEVYSVSSNIQVQLKMLFTVALACFVAAAAAAPNDIVVGYDLDDHEHTQKGQAGTAVTGSYSFTGADGVEHVVSYIADDKGYRVVGDARIEPKEKPATARPVPSPARAPAAAPTQAPAPAPTRPPTKAPAAALPAVVRPAAVRPAAPSTVQASSVAHLVPIHAFHAFPVQYVQLAQAPEHHSTVQVHSGTAGYFGYCFYAPGGLSQDGEQEVVGFDGTRYILKRV